MSIWLTTTSGIGWLLVAGLICLPAGAVGGELIVTIKNAPNVKLVGAINRWDADGNARVPVNPKAKIDAPPLTAMAGKASANRWVFSRLAPGRYDLVILSAGRIRVEGFHYPPVLEFDPFLIHADAVPAATRARLAEQIARSRHYENKVVPLYFSGDEKQVRVLVELLRDQPTSFDSQFGEQVATLRHEVWQFTNQYGGWAKEKRTRVLDRILMAKRQLRLWTWVWDPTLGGIQVAETPVEVSYAWPDRFDAPRVRGLTPY